MSIFGWVEDVWNWGKKQVTNVINIATTDPKCLLWIEHFYFWETVLGLSAARQAGLLKSKQDCFNAVNTGVEAVASELMKYGVPPPVVKIYGHCACKMVFEQGVSAPADIKQQITDLNLPQMRTGFAPSFLSAWGPGHLDLVGLFSDGRVKNKVWNETPGTWWPGQTEWSDLGGNCSSLPVISAWGPGHLDLVARFKDGHIRNKAWDASTGQWWPGQTEWADLGGNCIGSPSLCSWSPGHLDLVACFNDGHIRNKAWDASTGAWWPGQTEWADLGGNCSTAPAICSWGPGHLDVVARFKDGTIRNKLWDISTGQWWPGQTEWSNLGGDCVGSPVICAWSPGHLDIIARFKDGTIRNKVWDTSTGVWWPGQTEWANLGGDGFASPAMCAWAPGHLDVVACFSDGTIRNKVWDIETGEWWPSQTEWANLGGECSGPVTIVAPAPGRLDVVARFKDGTMRNKVWDATTGKWWPGQTEWANLG